MSFTKNFYFTFVFLLALTASYGQIVTSKKEAIKKGIYQKPSSETKSEVAVVVPKTTKKETKKVETKATPVKSSKNNTTNLKSVISEVNADDIEITESGNYLASQMINNAMAFLGVRYRGGGTSSDGMDCSGMVTAVYNLFDFSIPRSSHEMAKLGEKVDVSSVKKGDLIFFKTNGKRIINHVGMVVDIIGDEIKFIHSSTSQGVIISSTKENYYKKTFAQINRVL
ncbi:C40 family peptidase [Flavobacterium sp.]|uniref:C40 family peptidase n=1 Tax=Flavobacterium sp. TaxID=239 RepID=UPI00261BDA8F|nr:C40 family peptidase [Flavobacterium sp.]MDD3005514.1 C40 family peptidase [Flavobacterium sp.]